MATSSALTVSERIGTPVRRAPPTAPSAGRSLLPDEPIRNRVAEVAIGQLPSACPHCSTGMLRKELASHVESCDARTTPCAAAAEGCTWEGRVREQQAHEAGCMHAICLRMMSKRDVTIHRLGRRCALLEAQLLFLQPISMGIQQPTDHRAVEDSRRLDGPLFDGHRLRGAGGSVNGHMCTVGLPHMRLRTGIWYYEVEILQAPKAGEVLQIGWANSEFGCPILDPHRTAGVGSCEYSWAFDGFRKCCFHNGTVGALGPRAWQRGDVVSLILNLPQDNAGRAQCLVNNTTTGSQYKFTNMNPKSGMFPAISISMAETDTPVLEVNFGQKPFRFPEVLDPNSMQPVSDALLQDRIRAS
tara:strand:- start:2473 stop:3543 length:1071 start_codon:yes stop_codon:yes gene_type:complete